LTVSYVWDPTALAWRISNTKLARVGPSTSSPAESTGQPSPSGPSTAPAAKAIDRKTLDFLKERGWPTSGRLQIRGPRGIVDARNPYLAMIDTEEGLVTIGEGDGYAVLFQHGSMKFEIRVFAAPFVANRTAAERQLLGTLGVPASEACKLNIRVLDYTHDTRNPMTSLPSFCGSAEANTR